MCLGSCSGHRLQPREARNDNTPAAVGPMKSTSEETETANDLSAFLKANAGFFGDFPAERLRELVEGSSVRSFEATEVIMHRGEPATHFGVVTKGSAAGEGSNRVRLGELKPGDTFGELSLMTGDVMLADVVATSPCEVILIPVSLFKSLIVAEPGVVQRISRTIADRMKMLVSDPAKAAALRESDDPYDLKLKGERREKILVINCGSSSLKYSFYDTGDESRYARGLIERIGIDGTRLKHQTHQGTSKRDLGKIDFDQAFKTMLTELTAKETGAIKGASEVSVVAHRMVHGGEKFTEGTLISDEVIAEMEKLNPLAPLHNPVMLAGIRQMRRLFPAVPQVAVFDTAFHHTLPSYSYLYGLPYEFYEKKAVRRYGFHGSSHGYVALKAAEFLKRRPNELRLISCHLGNGSSLCAIDHGRSIDTTMGFTPVEGLIMGTRSGDLDPGIISYLEREEKLTPAQIDEILNKKSGLLGLSGISSDMREILAASDKDDRRALLALKTYCYRVRKYVGAYVASLGGVSALVFTGGIGEGSAVVRALALQGLECMGMTLDEARNRDACGPNQVCRISSDNSSVAVLVVPADEERMMAREALRTLSRSYITSRP